MTQPIRVALVEDQRQTREGLARLIGGTPGYVVTGEFGSMEDALVGFESATPDVVLLDIGLPGMTGIEGVRRLGREFPGLPVVMLTVYDDNERIFEAVCGGACGYLLKDMLPTKLLDAIREVHEGGAPLSPDVARKVVTMFQRVAPPRHEEHRLSPRELDVLKLFAAGHSYKTAAGALSLSEDTIRFHIRKIYDKLHVHSKSEAVLRAFQSGLL